MIARESSECNGWRRAADCSIQVPTTHLVTVSKQKNMFPKFSRLAVTTFLFLL